MKRSPEDILEAAPDAIAQALGVNVMHPHPFSDEIRDSPLSKLALAAGEKMSPWRQDEQRAAVIGRGMSTSDFSRLLAAGSQQLVERRFDSANVHRAFCAKLETRDFRPVSTASLDVDIRLPMVSELGEVQSGYAFVTEGNSSARLLTFAKNINFSRQVLVNDDVGVIRETLVRYAASAARTEALLVYEELERNPVLEDGEYVFDEAHGNVIADDLAEASLAEGMYRLRVQPTLVGDRADIAAKHLVVGANLEYKAKALVHDAGLDLVVTPSVNLPDGRWFLMADPDDQPVIAYLVLSGKGRSVYVDPLKPKISVDGFALRVTADIGAMMLGRLGIIRGGV